MEQTNGFGRFIRGKCFAVLFFIGLILANWFVYKEICAAVRFAGQDAPGLWLLALLLSLFFLYLVVWKSRSVSRAKQWFMYLDGLYISFFLYWVLSLLLFRLLAFLMEWIAPLGFWNVIGFYLSLICGLAIFLYGVIHARTVVPVHYTVSAGKSGKNVRIVLLSDVHLGIYNGARHLEKVVDAVNAEKPDLVVIAGDLFDGAQAGAFFDQAAAAAQFRRIQARDGVIFATGNHDPAPKSTNFRNFLHTANISMLNDTGVMLGDCMIFGRNDEISVQEPDRRRPLHLLCTGYHQRPMIVVDHNPQGADEAAALGADLVLCGHTHRGQMFPINLFTKWAYGPERFWGHHQLGKTHVVVSAGCSVFQLPVRVGTDNEVVTVDLIY